MTETSINTNQEQISRRSPILSFSIVLVIVSILMLAGCVHVLPQEQRLVSKPNMQFSNSAIFIYQDRLLTQFESGSASFTGAQSGECGSCAGGGQ